MSKQEMTERLAMTSCDVGWTSMTDALRAEQIWQWAVILQVIEAAGLTVVEAEDGR